MRKSETDYEQAAAAHGDNATFLDQIKLSAAIQDVPATPAQLKTLHTCIKKVTEDLEAMRFNTAISAMMVFINEAMTWKREACLRLPHLRPVARTVRSRTSPRNSGPRRIQNSKFKMRSLSYAPWPAVRPWACSWSRSSSLPVQINGKLRDVIKRSGRCRQRHDRSRRTCGGENHAASRGQNGQESHHRAEEDGEPDRGVSVETPNCTR